MFEKRKLNHDGAQAQALVLEKKIYATENDRGGRAAACRYQLRVKFEDGSTMEISRRAFDHKLAAAGVGDLIPVRYDPADRSKIELDRHAFVERQKADARHWETEAIARGDKELGLSPTATSADPVDDQPQLDTGDLRVSDADRELIAEVLNQHMTDGRLTTDELDDRLGAVYASQTRSQARSVLADLPPLAPSGRQHEAVLSLPGWASAPAAQGSRSPAPMPQGRPSDVAGPPVPTDGEMNTVYRRWQAKTQKTKADKAAQQQAEASGEPREIALASRRLLVSQSQEKSARAKWDQLRKRRPDWVPANAGSQVSGAHPKF
jgi:Domain of unknown function (DUF1707)